MGDEVWPTDWLRGALELCVLAVLAEAPAHGYAVAQRLAEAGLGAVRGGTLYPLLNRLESAGWVRSGWQAGDGGPGRKVFELTGPGRAEVERRAAGWAAFTGVVGDLVSRTTGVADGAGLVSSREWT